MKMGAQVHDLAGGDMAQPPYTEDWWRSRTSDELRDLVNRGLAGGDFSTAATVEAKRRSGEARRVADEQVAAASRQENRNRRKILVLRILVALSLLATLFTTVVVLMQLGTK